MASSPENMKHVQTDKSDNIQVVTLDSIPEYVKIDYMIEDDKDREKYFNDIEKIVRGSFEYQELVEYIKNNFDMKKCSFFESLDASKYPSIKIHLHHSPITLYEIVITIFAKRSFYGESIDPEMVAKEAAYCHYNFLIGLIPLCETVHELVHNQYIFVPNNKVLGHYEQFIDMYEPWIPDQIKSKYNKLEEFTKAYNEAENTKILQPNYIYLNTAGTYKLPKLEDVMTLLDTRMDAIRRNGYSNQQIPLIKFINN